ncbi:uncharacterized protein [Leptinotarsa decemlineata]|uniref:uncharacterized protein n=1 Tax=Leptinotarsa decemlineata TaxID=7539 RepID=UPI003D30A3A8
MAAYYWVDTVAYGRIPSTALPGGVDVDGEEIFVGRAFHEGDWLPAKVIPGKRIAYVCYNGAEVGVERFQVLCEQRFEWIPTSGGDIPEGAVEGGKTSDGEPLYIGRAYHEGSHTVGKVHPSHGCCYIPFNGGEHAHQQYETLVLRSCYGFKPEYDPHHQASGYYQNPDNHYPSYSPPPYPCTEYNQPVPPRQHYPVSHSEPGYFSKNNFHPGGFGNAFTAYDWVDTSAYGGVPSTALRGGVDVDGHVIYVGRAFHEGDWIPAKVIPGKNVAYIAYNGLEHAKDRFQVLCEQHFHWLPGQGGYVPPDAVEGGMTAQGEPLYIGRVYHSGSQTIGKVHPSHGVCYIPFDGREIAYPNYEILVLRR